MKNTSITVIGNYNYYQRSPAWVRALRELNFSVETVDEPLSKVQSNTFLSRLQRHYLIGKNFSLEKNDAIDKIMHNNSKINIFHKSLAFNASDIKKIKKNINSINILYNNDNIFGPLAKKSYWRRMRDAIPEFDLILAYRESCVENYYKYGAKSVYLLKSYFLPWLHYPDISGEKLYDITFIGHYENDNRADYLAGLIQACDAEYLLKGVDWNSVKGAVPWRNWSTDPIYGEEYANALRKSKIALAFFSQLNEDFYTRRVFEIPACGAMLLCPRTPVMSLLYKEDEEAVFFSSLRELIEKARYYLINDKERQRVIKNGHKRAIQSGYDIHSRLKEFLKELSKNWV